MDALPSRAAPDPLHRDILRPLFIGFLFNTVLAARLGEIVKVLLLRRRMERRGERPPTTTLLGTVVAENLVSTIMWVGLVVAIGLFLPLPSYAWFASIVAGGRAAWRSCRGPPVRARAAAAAVAEHRAALGAGAAGDRRASGARCARATSACGTPARWAWSSGASLLSWLAQWAGITSR